MTKTEAVISEIYDAWRSQDLDRLATYLPNDFSHVVYIPTEIHAVGGLCSGKQAALARLGLIAAEFDFLVFDTRELIVQKSRASVEIPIRYRHRQTGVELETIIANFWTFEEGWPVKLSEYHDIARIQAFAANVAALTG
ncbi:MAG TPA: nuclear transport factor 2 family protein [Methyloceanibacter sp.]|nr:nuclear transport factor 2 family protein [Methyloceanibacter sp.]